MSKSTTPQSPVPMSPAMAERILKEHRKMQSILRTIASSDTCGLPYELKDCIYKARRMCGWTHAEAAC